MTTFDSAMAANQRLAALSELLPATAPPRRGWRARLTRVTRFPRRRPRGLEAVPERYRLQFLLLASDAMPGRPPADVAAAAGALAGRTRIPGRLLAQLPDTAGLDQWFRDSSGQIKASLVDLLEAGTR